MENKADYIRARISKGNKELLRGAADESGITLSSWIVSRLLVVAKEELAGNKPKGAGGTEATSDAERQREQIRADGHCPDCYAPLHWGYLPFDFIDVLAQRYGGMDQLQIDYILDKLEEICRKNTDMTFGDLVDEWIDSGLLDVFHALEVAETIATIAARVCVLKPESADPP